ncbi:Cobalt uptake substrate-specific transmembrane region [Cribrihabitans marinus]|uniref:Cobalt uptake substrate-specific transmembrane region n=1 Tax=Cribrihabitans marinus TaxID=1227549 RepID=A0A1H7BBY1_9RHOB|nr:energy-coupling factor ABC transporter permease [Cribrihabitans marinus]GGH32882.1 cobalt transporter [Cribrihabitans marinus]SEJ70925.1 Cobalt uptake substrate-specific transmembrane region [Cribrihabitans marinus]
MHIEPGVVQGAKMVLAYGTTAAAAGYSLKLIAVDVKARALPSFALRSATATLGVLAFFEVLPHFPVGISEVHFILGTTLLLILGAAPAAVGLAAGLAIQGLIFAPGDLPMYAVNLTTLLVPLFAIHGLAQKALPRDAAYVDLKYADMLKLSIAYQGGVVAWVAFWAFYGQGVGADTMTAVGSFGAAYLMVILIEPLVDLAVLAGAKSLRGLKGSALVTPRLYAAG